MSKKILIKVGSRVLFDDQGMLDVQTIENLARQIATLTQNEHQIILVSSGATMTGIFSLTQENMLSHKHFKDQEKKTLAAHGQVELMSLYKGIFNHHNLVIGQILLSRHDFNMPISKGIKEVFDTFIGAKILPIVNENDPTAYADAKFTDNDELAYFLSKLLSVDLAIILTNVEGLFEAPPYEPGSHTLIKKVTSYNLHNFNFSIDSNLVSGRGGMQSKVMNAINIAKIGIPVFIVNGKKNHVLTNIVQDKKQEGTFFPPASTN